MSNEPGFQNSRFFERTFVLLRVDLRLTVKIRSLHEISDQLFNSASTLQSSKIILVAEVKHIYEYLCILELERSLRGRLWIMCNLQTEPPLK